MINSSVKHRVLKRLRHAANFCLKKTESGQYALKEEHFYWHQVQGEIHFSGRKFCNFVVRTSKDAVVLKIAKGEAWSENISKLTQFYFEHLLLKIVEGQLLVSSAITACHNFFRNNSF